ncbi:MAG TPA: hypothetical protein VGO75_13510 [Gemmatimonadaceae bacterium]|nr:hypothetical protein [Gemmatimonadaceae bacterium]
MRRKIAIGTGRKLIWLSLSLGTANACKDTPWTPSGSAEVVLSEIKLGGATSVAKRIDANESFGRSVMNGIETGDSAWLEVADRIKPASGAAEASLSIALASALPHAPQRVLSLLGPKYPVEDVCGIPFLKPEPTLISTYHDEAVSALGRVRSVPLTQVRDACVAALDRAREYRLERIDPAYIVKNKPVAPARRRRR